MQIYRNHLHNAFCVPIETGNIHVLPKLTHFLVNLHRDIDVRIYRIFPQKRFDSKLQVGVRTARRNANRPVDCFAMSKNKKFSLILEE